jgi:hypothetical protein
MFPDCYDEYGENLDNDRVAIIHGSIAERDDGKQINIRDVHILDSYLPKLVKDITWVIKPDEKGEEFLEFLRNILDHNMGDCKIHIGFQVDNQILMADVAGSLTINLRGEVYQKICRHPAIIETLIKTIPIPTPQPRKWGNR